ncbi:hypothetical protein SAMN04489712_103320 [Thermomonospora echinospora]|uniref:Uncharacterized protein n=1 Tax=Thermomonospora echinospora TaxID=1992 RepID=A0A1H5XM85_9ACTN|nr:hypothetical protein [Thermomonospora echinospora]SEG12894.1 hypothetical protein SAMN04489712_103320 [Thermomonospora echinospora]
MPGFLWSADAAPATALVNGEERYALHIGRKLARLNGVLWHSSDLTPQIRQGPPRVFGVAWRPDRVSISFR